MPVCLKCGKEIDPGSNFCEDCADLGPEEVQRLMDLGRTSKYKPQRSRSVLWLTIVIVVLFLIAIGVAWALLSMIPNNARLRAQVRANVCHHNLDNIQIAIDKYYKNSHQNPTAGRLSARNPLVIDGYLSGVPHCPSTGHEYVIEKKPNEETYTVKCDSGLAGHSL